VSGSVADNNDEESRPSVAKRLRTFVDKNFFLAGMFVAVGFARLFPALGRNGGVLRPELFTGKYGVTLIFLLSGLSLELSQLTKALANWKLNGLIQLMSFAAWPFLLGVPVRTVLTRTGWLPTPLLDGLLILSCLPTTVNMCVILTSASSGNVAVALCNAVISNLAGIFVTPALMFRFFGSQIQLPFLDMLMKLSNKVLLPVVVGQVLRQTSVKEFYDAHKKQFKRLQEVILLSILWNAFCTAWTQNSGLSLQDAVALLTILPVMHVASLAVIFGLFSRLRFGRGDVVAALFCASQKTLAFGLPLIQTVFEGSSYVASYSAPIMLCHPLQLMIGSLLVPSLEKYTAAEEGT
jgi:sodium/bile acid cotransporter 7